MKTACEETKYQGRNHVFSTFVIPEDAVSRFCRNDKSHLEVWGSAVVPRISELSSLQHKTRTANSRPQAHAFLALPKCGPCGNVRPNRFILHEPEKYRSQERKHSVTKTFPPVAPGFRGQGSLGCPGGRLFHLPGVEQGGLPAGCTPNSVHRIGLGAASASRPALDTSSVTSLTEVRLPAPDIMTGQKATMTLCRSDFSGPRPPDLAWWLPGDLGPWSFLEAEAAGAWGALRGGPGPEALTGTCPVGMKLGRAKLSPGGATHLVWPSVRGSQVGLRDQVVPPWLLLEAIVLTQSSLETRKGFDGGDGTHEE